MQIRCYDIVVSKWSEDKLVSKVSFMCSSALYNSLEILNDILRNAMICKSELLYCS